MVHIIMNAHIYCVTNLMNSKQYVGQTTVSRNKVGHGCTLKKAYEKYGENQFLYEKVCTSILNKDTLNYLERFWISVCGTISPYGYNIEQGGSDKGNVSQTTRLKLRIANSGKKLSLETKLKISLANKGEKNSFYGKTHSPEALAKISAASIGRTHVTSEEQKRKISIANAGEKNGMFGKKHTEETKAKFKGRLVTRYWLGKKFSDSARNKMSQAAKLRPALTCPYCNKTGGFNGMKRHHMDNCKQKDIKWHLR